MNQNSNERIPRYSSTRDQGLEVVEPIQLDSELRLQLLLGTNLHGGTAGELHFHLLPFVAADICR
uniref:Uncharacterized protein n=1 Tax=Arundo donax TaxID=35708 RepID=A0A0A9A457_ARUDO